MTLLALAPARSAIIVCLAIVALSALCDLVTRRIPNLLTLGGVVLGIVLHGAVGWTVGGASGALRGALFSVIGAVVCSVLPMISFARREMGGGDVKLFAAIGALAGPSLGINAEALAFIVVFIVLWPWRLLRAGMVRRLLAKESVKSMRLSPVVLGPSIFVGLLIAVARQGALGL